MTPELKAHLAPQLQAHLASPQRANASALPTAVWTQAYAVAREWFIPNEPLLDPGCFSVTNDPTRSVMNMTCFGANFAAGAFGEAQAGGLLRASETISLSPFGRFIPNGHAPGPASYAFIGNTGIFTPKDPTAPPVATTRFDFHLEGSLIGERGIWTGPSAMGPAFHNLGLLDLLTPAGDNRQVYVDWINVASATPNVTWEGVYNAADTTGPGPRYTASAIITAHFDKIPVRADGTLDFQLSLWTVGIFFNATGYDMSYSGARNSTDFSNTARLTAVHAFDANGNDISSKYTFTLASGETIPSGGTQGCGHGYWKNHESSWPATHPTSEKFNTVFGVTWFDPNLTLGAALKLQGGKQNEVARQGVAALLNAAHTEINSPYTVTQVISLVRAIDAAALIASNELGCPLN